MIHKLEKSALATFPEFDKHAAVFRISNPSLGLIAYIAIHRSTAEYPAFGATRFWKYSSEKDALRDALKLSRLMSYKAALAGLPYRGAKGVIIKTAKSIKNKDRILKAYAEYVDQLKGLFITGADVGISPADVSMMRACTPYMVGILSDPVFWTARGVFHAIRVSLRKRFGTEVIKGRTFAVQGVGKIGHAIIAFLHAHGGTVYISDINPAATKKAVAEFPNSIIISPKHIQFEAVDIYVPCALSNVLNEKTIPKLRCKIVVGGANNQLSSRAAGKLLHTRGILYAPDYVANAGGLISVVDEYEHANHNPTRVERKVSHIARELLKIYKTSIERNIPTDRVADDLAEKIFNARQ